jgi:hypothetical protein
MIGSTGLLVALSVLIAGLLVLAITWLFFDPIGAAIRWYELYRAPRIGLPQRGSALSVVMTRRALSQRKGEHRMT